MPPKSCFCRLVLRRPIGCPRTSAARSPRALTCRRTRTSGCADLRSQLAARCRRQGYSGLGGNRQIVHDFAISKNVASLFTCKIGSDTAENEPSKFSSYQGVLHGSARHLAEKSCIVPTAELFNRVAGWLVACFQALRRGSQIRAGSCTRIGASMLLSCSQTGF